MKVCEGMVVGNKVPEMDWSAQNPDLNPIKRLFDDNADFPPDTNASHH
jgi:hypothetical protein